MTIRATDIDAALAAGTDIGDDLADAFVERLVVAREKMAGWLDLLAGFAGGDLVLRQECVDLAAELRGNADNMRGVL